MKIAILLFACKALFMENGIKNDDEVIKETYFSLEESLLGIINFIKKYLVTLRDCVIRPGKLIEIIFVSQQPDPAKAGKNIKSKAAQVYAGAFLYLILSVIFTFCFYRTKVFNIVNNLTQGIKQKVLSSIEYLIDASLLRHLIACGIAVSVIWVIARILAWVYKKANKERAFFYIIPPLIYYFLGTMILVYIGFDYFAAWVGLADKYINLDTVNVIWAWGYCLWIAIHLMNYLKGEPGNRWLATIFIVAMIFIMPFVIQDLFRSTFDHLGYLKYKGRASISGTHYDNKIAVNIRRSGSRVTFFGQVLIANNSQEMIHLLSDSIKITTISAKKKEAFSGYMVLTLKDSSTVSMTSIPKEESVLCLYTWETDVDMLERLKTANAEQSFLMQADLNYAPKDLKERKRHIELNCFLADNDQ